MRLVSPIENGAVAYTDTEIITLEKALEFKEVLKFYFKEALVFTRALISFCKGLLTVLIAP